MDFVSYMLVAVIGYLLGSVPTGFVVGLAKGLDIRSVGSGNIGATNVFRALGVPAGIFVLLADGLKGFAAAWWIADWVCHLTGRGAHLEYLRITAGLCAILGHNYTCWLKFKGGKGIATSAGVLAALVPWALLIAFIIWLGVFTASRYVSLASLVAAFVLPFATWITHGNSTMIAVTAGMAVLAIYQHRSNIQRLLKGTEHRFGAKREAAS